VLATLFALLALAGQCLAAVTTVEMPCAGSEAHASPAVQHGVHHGIHQRADNSASATACECCRKHDCSMIQCITTPAAVAGSVAPGPMPVATVVTPDYSTAYAALTPTAPFRPPISR